MRILIIGYNLLGFSLCESNDVDYYVNLIESESKRAATFVLPTHSKTEKPFSKDFIEYGKFDHIVVGAGSAGGIVASRLSEDQFREVLLLEAGGPDTNFTEIPGVMGILWDLEYNWGYHTVPQSTYCLGMKEKRCSYLRGKALGGSSTINSLIYTRGSKRDFDNWCAEGNPGWCYKDVLPYFKKVENSNINDDPFYHGFGGYINLEYSKPHTKKQRAFIEANIELNRTFLDYNGFRQEGVGMTQMNTKNGRRCSTGTTYLRTAFKRKNLKILTQSHVTRVLINPKTKTAFGVLFAKNNKYYVAKSRKDIVISAGAIGSPQLLMLSGVGPNLHIQQFGIPVLENLSVGIMIILLHPQSRGYIKLKSSDPFDYPIIDSRGFSDVNYKDIETVYEGVHLCLNLLETKAFKNLDAKLHRVHLPTCKEFVYMSKDYWYCHMRQLSSSFAHVVGTCKMGPDPFQGAVVDHQLKVYGINNLRVADASIMPLIPGAHTNAPTMMIGEKAAAMIRL
ncbi:hypothetical protein FQR65_LT08171 [Abscondita terminalis]|nr:hypothetical protein FQR65_LT08171 [Abscondita terminalis]